MNVAKICSNITNKTQVLRESAAQRQTVVERAAQIYNYCPTKTKVKKFTSGIAGYVAPVLKKAKEDSPSLSALTETISALRQSISKAKRAPENEGLSNIRKTLQGIKNSKNEVGHSLGGVIGVNDIVLAKEQAGTGRAILEGGKSALRVLTSGALSAACIPVPIPGAIIGGWFAGEKIVEKIVGKPFSKQIQKLK